MVGGLEDEQTFLVGGELDIGVVLLGLLLEDDGGFVALGRFEVFSGLVEVNAGEVVAIGMAVLFELVGGGFWTECRQHIRLLLDNLLAVVLAVLGLEGLVVLFEIFEAIALLEVLLNIVLALVDDVDSAEEVIGVLVGFGKVEVAE